MQSYTVELYREEYILWQYTHIVNDRKMHSRT